MFAVVDILGHQFKVTENETYYVPKLNQEVNSEVTFDSVLMIGDEKKVKIGHPTVKDSKVTAKILEHLRDDKVTVFKKKRRISYQKSGTHRQHLTRIEIIEIA